MYNLYINNNGWQLITKKEYEQEIVYELEYAYRHNKGGYYGITRDIGNGDEVVKFIRNEEDYNNYMQQYKNKMLKELSIIELKQQILDIKDDNSKLRSI